MMWQEIGSREYLRLHQSYSSLKIKRNEIDEMEYTFRGQPVLKATNMRGYPRYWKQPSSAQQPKAVYTSRNDVPVNQPHRHTTMADKEQTKSKKDQAKDILVELKTNSTLNRATAIRKFVDQLGVSDAYAATLWQSLKDKV